MKVHGLVLFVLCAGFLTAVSSLVAVAHERSFNKYILFLTQHDDIVPDQHTRRFSTSISSPLHGNLLLTTTIVFLITVLLIGRATGLFKLLLAPS